MAFWEDRLGTSRLIFKTLNFNFNVKSRGSSTRCLFHRQGISVSSSAGRAKNVPSQDKAKKVSGILFCGFLDCEAFLFTTPQIPLETTALQEKNQDLNAHNVFKTPATTARSHALSVLIFFTIALASVGF